MGSAACGGEKGSASQEAIASKGRVNNAHPIEEHVKIITKVLNRMKLSEQERQAWELVIQAQNRTAKLTHQSGIRVRSMNSAET